MNLRRRIEQAEAVTGAGKPCPECGSVNGEPPEDVWSDVEVVILDWIDDDPDGKPEFCETCGTQTVFLIHWGP
jgi:hypothetical protein